MTQASDTAIIIQGVSGAHWKAIESSAVDSPEGAGRLQRVQITNPYDDQEVRLTMSNAIKSLSQSDMPSTRATQQLAAMVIRNFARVRDELGLELAAAWRGDDDDEALDEVLVEMGLERRELPPADLLDCVEQVMRFLPDVEWDDTMLADALYVELYDLQQALKPLLPAKGEKG